MWWWGIASAACDRLGCAEADRDERGCCPAAVAAPAPAAAPSPVEPPAAPVDGAFEQLKHAKRVEAIAKLEQLLAGLRPTEVAAELRLRLAILRLEGGQYLVARGDPAGRGWLEQGSALARRVLEEVPAYQRTDQVLLVEARCRADLGDGPGARARLDELGRRFPASSFAPEAAALRKRLP